MNAKPWLFKSKTWLVIMSVCAGVNFMGAVSSLAMGRVGLGIFQMVALLICVVSIVANYDSIK